MKEKIVKVGKLSILLFIRQMWATICNLYLLIHEPFLTVRKIKIRRDKSQALILGLIFVSPALVYIVARITTDLWWYRRLLLSVGPVFEMTTLVEMLILGYLFYWIYQVISKNHFKDFKEKI